MRGLSFVPQGINDSGWIKFPNSHKDEHKVIDERQESVPLKKQSFAEKNCACLSLQMESIETMKMKRTMFQRPFSFSLPLSDHEVDSV